MKLISYILLSSFLLISCAQQDEKSSDKIHIVTTTSIITDLVENIGGDLVEVSGLMGSGIDPHLYKASEGDVTKLSRADIIIYNGLHLEGKMVDIFEQMERQKKAICNLGKSLDPSKLRSSASFGGNYDPHVWFDISLFMDFAREAARALIEYYPEGEDYFNARLSAYLEKLNLLDKELKDIASTLPQDKRRLVTAHDAFSYFGEAYGFEVVGLQGISTATEAGVQDVRKLTDYIVENEVKSIFIESSVPIRTINALRQAVKSKGHEVAIGGMIYSDALGDPDTEEGTYIGMFKYNMSTITNGLK